MSVKNTKPVNDVDNETSAKIKAELLERKRQVEEDMSMVANKEGRTEKMVAKFPDYGEKIDENAQEISEYSTNLATEKVLENTLRDINAALKRIEDGTYGICKYCGRPIGKKRMLARPVASACVECKMKLQNAA